MRGERQNIPHRLFPLAQCWTFAPQAATVIPHVESVIIDVRRLLSTFSFSRILYIRRLYTHVTPADEGTPPRARAPPHPSFFLKDPVHSPLAVPETIATHRRRKIDDDVQCNSVQGRQERRLQDHFAGAMATFPDVEERASAAW